MDVTDVPLLSPFLWTTRLSLSSCLAVRLVSNMKVFMREQISLGAMVTLSVTQAPRSILPMGSKSKLFDHVNITSNNSLTLDFLILRVFPECESVALQHHPPSVPGPEAGHVVKHGEESFVGNLNTASVNIRTEGD